MKGSITTYLFDADSAPYETVHQDEVTFVLTVNEAPTDTEPKFQKQPDKLYTVEAGADLILNLVTLDNEGEDFDVTVEIGPSLQ